MFFPKDLLRSYEDLLEFNKRISSGRTARLSELRKKLISERDRLTERLAALDARRVDALKALTQRDTLKKFRALQGELHDDERKIGELRGKLHSLDTAGQLRRQIQEVRREKEDYGAQLEAAVHNATPRYLDVRRSFSEHVERVLGIEAILAASLNKEQNLDFTVKTLDRDTALETSEGRGTSYTKWSSPDRVDGRTMQPCP